MILPDFVLPSRINQCWEYSGIDSIDHCKDKKHFKSYPYTVCYNYNSRGFRDLEWPTNQLDLQRAIWCVGDSFTVGVGSPLEHTWPWLLQQRLKNRTVNISMDGASNTWVSRKVCRVIEEINPKTLIIHWSYISRRELDLEEYFNQQWNKFYKDIRDKNWPDCTRQQRSNLPVKILQEIDHVHGGWQEIIPSDELRMLQTTASSTQEDLEHILNCIKTVQTLADKNFTTLIHSFIPEFVPAQLKGKIESQIQGYIIPEIIKLDLARDGHHYDIQTSNYFVEQIMQFLS